MSTGVAREAALPDLRRGRRLIPSVLAADEQGDRPSHLGTRAHLDVTRGERLLGEAEHGVRETGHPFARLCQYPRSNLCGRAGYSLASLYRVMYVDSMPGDCGVRKSMGTN